MSHLSDEEYTEIMKLFSTHLGKVMRINDDGGEEDILCFQDNNMFITEKEVALGYIDKLLKFYNGKGIEDYIFKENTERLLYMDGFNQNEEGLFDIPHPKIDKREFNYKKRKWSFHCAWCNKKINRDVQDHYFLAKKPKELYIRIDDIERACSSECASLVWKDNFKNWINENGYKTFFDMNSFDRE